MDKEEVGFELNGPNGSFAFAANNSHIGEFATETEFAFDEDYGPDVFFNEEENYQSRSKCDSLESSSVTSAGDMLPRYGEQAFANSKAPLEERDRDAFGRSIPKYRTAWRIDPNQPCVNYYVLSAEVVPSSEKKCEPVQLPTELVLALEDMHCRELQGSRKVFEKLFTGKPKQYIYGNTFEPAPDTWTLFWDPYRLAELTTLTIQSTICAALNSRRRLAFIMGIGQEKKVYRPRVEPYVQFLTVKPKYIEVCLCRLLTAFDSKKRLQKVIGCELSRKERDTMQELFQLCVTTEFVPPLDQDLVTFRFHPVYDQSGSEIPSRYLAEVGIKDKVTTLYQLSSGRIYYADGNAVVRTRTFSDARRMLLLRRRAELNEALKDPARCLTRKPRLRNIEESSHTHLWPSAWDLLLFGLPGFVLGLVAYDYCPRILTN